MTTSKRNPIEHKSIIDPEQVSDRYPYRHPLDTGDRGVQVLYAQSKLAELQMYNGPLDGRFDREVTLAVRTFQSETGLKITGIIDRKTWDSL